MEKFVTPWILGRGVICDPTSLFLTNGVCVCVRASSFCVPEKAPRMVDLGAGNKNRAGLRRSRTFFYFFALCDFMNNTVT